MPIFQDVSGMAIKFFVQKDIAQEIQAEVCETIAALGGRVESKVPRAGFILVQPGTPEEERLRLCWSTADRPERYFVPYTYVEACKISGMLLKQIFVHDGRPIRMHIDSSIANVNVRTALSTRIMHSGGDPTASAQSARVILADPNTDIFEHLVKTYQGEADKFVESYLWVKKCVEKGQVIYTPVVYKNPGGRRAGEERTQFSEDDERRLCEWIAQKIPYKETGGRTGNRLYRQLCELSEDPEYAWVTRHTWQSWRERYKKNATRLDVQIAAIVEEKKPALGEKGQYAYVRQPEEKPKRTRKKRSTGNADTAESVAGPSGISEIHPFDAPMPMPIASIASAIGAAGSANDGFHPIPYAAQTSVFQHVPAPPPAPPPVPAAAPPPLIDVATQRHEEEMDDEDEWQIRVGTGPAPAWAKRKAEEEEGPVKRQRTSPPEDAMHPVDQAVHGIAREFRFTVEEVQEYYDKCGDPERTRTRFMRMRAVLNTLKDDDDILTAPGSQSF